MTERALTNSEDALHYGESVLRGDEVLLRATTDDDIRILTDWWSRPEWAVLQQAVIKPRPNEAVGEMIASWSKNDSPGSVGFSIDNAAGELVGHATLWGAALPARIAEYAIIIGPEFVGYRYGTDATRVMLRYAFDELGVHKVELKTWAYNTPALRAYEKAGFMREGVRRAAAFHNGTFHDEVLMGVLLEDFCIARDEED